LIHWAEVGILFVLTFVAGLSFTIAEVLAEYRDKRQRQSQREFNEEHD
jgi:hypothetical protein